MSHSGAIEYAKINPGLKPIVRVIDNWSTNRPLVLLLEARQLLASLRAYMTSPDFALTD